PGSATCRWERLPPPGPRRGGIPTTRPSNRRRRQARSATRRGRGPGSSSGRRRPGGERTMKKRTRREFVRDVGAAAVVLGSPLPRGLFAGVRAGSATEARPLFFNLSHLKGRQTTHFLYLAGRKYRMTSVAERPDVLDVERRRNVFLAAVPDDQITHHVQGALVPLDAMALAYSTSDENPSDGTWAMTSMFFQLPLYAVTHAYERARAHTPSGPLKLSGKRKRYGLRAALSEQDMREEQSLVDFSSHAEALVGLHPDILSLEPNSGAHIQNN